MDYKPVAVELHFRFLFLLENIIKISKEFMDSEKKIWYNNNQMIFTFLS